MCVLIQVPAYADFIKERFERCLDLYLCPRTRRKRLFVPDAKALVPKLPKPRDLQPFPTTLALRYLGHKAAVCPSQSGLTADALQRPLMHLATYCREGYNAMGLLSFRSAA